MREEKVGIRQFKTRLSRYVRHVREGGTVIITDRGKPVGRLVPVGADRGQRMQELVEAGLVAWNGQKLRPVRPVASVHGRRTVSDLVLENRE
jgi:prevent-host-death family protein